MLEDFERQYRKERYRKSRYTMAFIYTIGGLALLWRVLREIGVV